MYIDGPDRIHLAFPASSAAGFSPDGRFLIYNGSPGDLDIGIYVFDTTSPEAPPRRLTNIGLMRTVHASQYVIPSIDSSLTWFGHTFTYRSERDATTITIDIESGLVDVKKD